MKKTLLAMKQWVVDEMGLVGSVILICSGFIGGVIYGQSSATLTIAQINATHAQEIQRMADKQATELKAVQDRFALTIEKKDGTSRALVQAVTEKLKADTKDQSHGK